MNNRVYALEEIGVALTIEDGKLVVESRSGTKRGSIELTVDDFEAEITLLGSGNDRATATLSGPELSNFRTNIDAGLSALLGDRSSVEHDQRILASGFETLGPVGDGFGTTFDTGALQALGIVDDEGALPGGSRQIKSTVLNSGTAIVNLLSDDEPEFTFADPGR